MDVAGPRDADIVGSQPLCRPKSLPAGEIDEDPSLVGVGEQVGVTAIGTEPVPVDELADDLHRVARRVRALHDDTRQVTVVRPPGLRIGRHVAKLLAARRPHITRRHAVLVEPAIGERRREAGVL